MTRPLDDVCCASLPLAALPALAAVRCVPDVTVALVGERAWLRWPPGSVEVLHCVAAIAGVELFKPYKGTWYRPGQHLPAFGLPHPPGPPLPQGERGESAGSPPPSVGEGPGVGVFSPPPSVGEGPGVGGVWRPLLQMLVPTPVHPELAPEPTLQPVAIRLVREDRPRLATALWCNLSALRKWADRAPTAEMASVHAARCDEQVLLLGRRLPPLPAAERLWGERLLIPLGYRPEPALPESALLDALQVSSEELVVCRTALESSPDSSGVPSYGAHFDIVPRTALQPLTRSAVRLAMGEAR